MKARGIYVEVAGELQPGPAPRFSRSAPAAPREGIAATPQTVQELLRGWLDDEEIVQAVDDDEL